MPRDFKSFAKENQNKNENKDSLNEKKSFLNEKKSFLNENQEKVNAYQDILNKYKNMDNNELMANLFSEASKLKNEGKLDSNTLNSLQSTLSPFLNNEQQEMLNSLVKAINEQK